MKRLPSSNKQLSLDLVIVKDGKPTTTSLIVAERFGKAHKDVLKAVENLECSQEFRERNFALSNYLSRQEKSMPCVEMTRDGFVFLAMGFTGSEAAKWKEEFIGVFNAMESKLLKRNAPIDPTPAFLEHLDHQAQINNVKLVGGVLYEHILNDEEAVGFAEYHVKVCRGVTDQHERPSQIKQRAKDLGIKSKYRESGRKAMRAIEPCSAAAASLADSLVAHGGDVNDSITVAESAKAVFAGMLRLGVVPREMLFLKSP